MGKPISGRDIYSNKKGHPLGGLFNMYGALGRIRTFDRSVRSRVLYPAELRVRYLVFPRSRTIGEGRVGVN